MNNHAEAITNNDQSLGVRHELERLGFDIAFDLKPFTFVRTAYGPVAVMDGLLAARQKWPGIGDGNQLWLMKLRDWKIVVW